MRAKLIAELSMNHMGDHGLMEEMIAAAAQSGADYVKFQTWKVCNLKHGPWDNDSRKEVYKKSEIDSKKMDFILDKCDKNKIKFLTSCFYDGDLDFIRSYSDEVKIPGPESSNIPLMEKAISLFSTVYMSTGSSNVSEFTQWIPCDNVYVMHCVSCYPCPSENANMNRMLYFKTLTERYGYSGHCLGIDDAILAISLGAKVVEKHFTTDKNLPFVDNSFSILPDEMAAIKKYAIKVEKMVINKGLDCQEQEYKVRDTFARRWCK